MLIAMTAVGAYAASPREKGDAPFTVVLDTDQL